MMSFIRDRDIGMVIIHIANSVRSWRVVNIEVKTVRNVDSGKIVGGMKILREPGS